MYVRATAVFQGISTMNQYRFDHSYGLIGAFLSVPLRTPH